MGLPLLLVNARITEKSFKRWRLVENFAKKIFSKFNLCIASNKDSENFLEILGAKNIKNYGNLKFSQVKNGSSNKLDSSFLDKIKNRKKRDLIFIPKLWFKKIHLQLFIFIYIFLIL